MRIDRGMPFRVLRWGIKHPRLLVKAYTIFFISLDYLLGSCVPKLCF